MERLLRKLTDGYGDVGVVCVSCRHDLASMRASQSGFARSFSGSVRIRAAAADPIKITQQTDWNVFPLFSSNF